MAVPKLVSGPMPPRRLLGRPEAQDLAATRLPWVFGFMAFGGVLIFLRLIWLQGIEHRTYRERADRQHTTVVPIPPIRGEIRDRRGQALAIQPDRHLTRPRVRHHSAVKLICPAEAMVNS